jgi:hypothetical protein
MNGIQETGEYTPMLAWTFKELANKLPESAYNAQAIKSFAADLDDSIDDADEDYSFTLKEYDEYDDY